MTTTTDEGVERAERASGTPPEKPTKRQRQAAGIADQASGGIGVLLGFPLADPVVGLAISAAILVLLWGTVHSVGARLMDRIDPDLVDRAEHALGHVGGITAVREVRLRWVGHRLQGDAVIEASDRSLAEAERLLAEADRELRAHLPNLEEMRVRAVPTAESSA